MVAKPHLFRHLGRIWVCVPRRINGRFNYLHMRTGETPKQAYMAWFAEYGQVFTS